MLRSVHLSVCLFRTVGNKLHRMRVSKCLYQGHTFAVQYLISASERITVVLSISVLCLLTLYNNNYPCLMCCW